MGYQYSDAEMLLATQVAYLDCDNMRGRSVYEIYSTFLRQYCEKDANGNYVAKADLPGDGSKRAETVLAMNKIIGDNPQLSNSIQSWKVVDVCNDNNRSGFYGAVIDTGDNNAIIGCRGSESFDLYQGVMDWAVSDFGLLDGQLTVQQKVAEQYMQQIYYKYGDKYQSFSLTGHSLGGNLAEHMAIMAPAGMRDKIDHVISFDGPGFSEEYIQAHMDRIQKIADKMDHYQWSVVSSMLNPLPGVQDTVIKAHDDPDHSGIAAMFVRHATTNVELKDGHIQPGEGDALSAILGPYSRFIEQNDLFTMGVLSALSYNMGIFGIVIRFGFHLKLFINALRFFHEAANRIKAFADSIYYNYIAPNVSGEYTVDINAMKANANALQGTVRDLMRKAGEIENIRRNLQYWSEIGGFYRSRIMVLNTSIIYEINSIQKLGSLVPEMMQRYDTGDQRAQDVFCSIKNTA